ncbi:hypothetical protein ACFL6C_09895, partial [Myxococcota bacterium]
SGPQLAQSVREGIDDADGQAAGQEFDDFKKFVDSNQVRLSVEAREAFAIYERVVMEHRNEGMSGIPASRAIAMLKDMEVAATYRDQSTGS